MDARLAKVFVIAVSIVAVTVVAYTVGIRTIGMCTNDVCNEASPFWQTSANRSSAQNASSRTLQFQIPRYKNIQFVHEKTLLKRNPTCGNLADILTRGEIVICALKKPYNQFFQMKTKNGYIGEDIRLATELGRALGVKVIYKMAYDTNEDVVNAIHNGEGDIGLAKLSYTMERARKVAYSRPYAVVKKVVLLNRITMIDKDKQTLNKILNNLNAKIAVMQNTSYITFAKDLFPNAQIYGETEWENGAVKKLVKGEVVALIRDELQIKSLMKEQPELLLNFIPITLKDQYDSISAITNLKAHSLISYIDKFLENEYKVRTVKEILHIYKDYLK